MADTGTKYRKEAETLVIERLAVGSIDKRAAGWQGVLTLVLTEAFLFTYLLFSYYYFAVHYGRPWLPAELPSFKLSGPNTVILIVSSIAVWWGERGARKGSRGQLAGGLAVGLILGLIFVGIQLVEWHEKPFTLSSHSYGSIFFIVTGFHMAHVVAGLLVLAPLTLWSALGYFDDKRHAAVSIGALYWHFVDVVWLTVFFTFYITPYLG